MNLRAYCLASCCVGISYVQYIVSVFCIVQVPSATPYAGGPTRGAGSPGGIGGTPECGDTYNQSIMLDTAEMDSVGGQKRKSSDGGRRNTFLACSL